MTKVVSLDLGIAGESELRRAGDIDHVNGFFCDLCLIIVVTKFHCAIVATSSDEVMKMLKG